jgi:hypothetical protein
MISFDNTDTLILMLTESLLEYKSFYIAADFILDSNLNFLEFNFVLDVTAFTFTYYFLLHSFAVSAGGW